MAVTRSGPGVTPPADRRRWVPLLRLASRLSFYPRHWLDWRSSVKSRCEPPINGAVVEIVAYLKNNGKRGVFPFPSRRFISMTTDIFYFWKRTEEEKKRTEKIIFYFFSFLFSFFFNSHRVSFFGDRSCWLLSFVEMRRRWLR